MRTLIFVMLAVTTAAGFIQNGTNWDNLAEFTARRMKDRHYDDVRLIERCNGTKSQVMLLLEFLTQEYLHGCLNVILYEKFFEKKSSTFDFDLKNLLTEFPTSYINGQITNTKKIERSLLKPAENKCRNFILLLSDVTSAAEIIGNQLDSKVIVVTTSTRWRIEEYLETVDARKIVNLLIVSSTLSQEFLIRQEEPSTKAQDINLYTHELYVDGVGSSKYKFITAWRCGRLTRNVNVFPPKMTKGFNGRQFTVSVSMHPPFTFRKNMKLDVDSNESQIWEGVEMKLLRLLARFLNYTLEIKESKTTRSTDIGPSEVVISEVASGGAEIGAAGVYTSALRMDKVSMSIPHSIDCAAFITRASTALPRYRAILGPFQWTVWLALTLTYLLAIFPITFADKHSLTYLIKHPWQIENMFWYVFGTFTNLFTFQGENSWQKAKKNASRMLIGWYWGFTIIITACYTGSIVSFITLFVYPDVIDHVDQLVKQNFRVGTLSTGGWGKWFEDSEHEKTKYLLRDMELIPNVTQGLKNVSNSFYLPMFRPYAFLAGRAQMEYVVQANFTTMKRKQMLHITKECFVPFGVSFVFPLDAAYRHQFNSYILRVQQSGLMNKLLNEFKWEMERSSSGTLLQAGTGSPLRQAIATDRKLTLDDTQGMYLLMGAGYLIAMVALLSENVHSILIHRKEITLRSRAESLLFWKSDSFRHHVTRFSQVVMSIIEAMREENHAREHEYSSYKTYDSRILHSKRPSTPYQKPAPSAYFSDIHLDQKEEVPVTVSARSLPNMRHSVRIRLTPPSCDNLSTSHQFGDESLKFGSINSLPWDVGNVNHLGDNFLLDRARSS